MFQWRVVKSFKTSLDGHWLTFTPRKEMLSSSLAQGNIQALAKIIPDFHGLFQQFWKPLTVLVPSRGFSVERNFLCKDLLYTDDDFHLNLGFNFSTQTMVFTFKTEKVLSTDSGFSLKYVFTKKFSTQTITLHFLNKHNEPTLFSFLYNKEGTFHIFIW